MLWTSNNNHLNYAHSDSSKIILERKKKLERVDWILKMAALFPSLKIEQRLIWNLEWADEQK